MEDWDEVIVGFIVSMILGILPSFLLFSIFNQFDFSIQRYLNYLLDVNSSLVSLLSIFVIAIIVFLFMIKIESKVKKILVVFITLFLLLAFVVLYLYANFLLGNDILVKLSADKENIFFYDSPSQTITFAMSVFMNPFCMAQCEYSFFDISSGKTIETGEISLTSVLPKSQEYAFSNEGKIQGQELNRFEISCKSQKTRLCYTSEEESKRAILITLNYDFSEEQKIANEISKQEIISLEKRIYNLSVNLNETNLKINSLSNFIPTEGFLTGFLNLSSELFDLNSSFEKVKQAWKLQNYSKFEQDFPSIKEKINNLSAREDKFILLVNSNIFAYNNLANALNGSRNILKQIPLDNLSETSCIELNETIAQLNETIQNFKEKTNLSYKKEIVDALFLRTNKIYESSEENNGTICSLTNTINEEIITEIIISPRNGTIPEFYLEDPSPICCFYGKCEKCCDETCSDKNYPIVFLHGHSISKTTSADYSLDVFGQIKNNLIEEGYIDAGAVIISSASEQTGLWGKVNASIEVTGSYFFDVSKSETGEETIVSSKSDSIDTYALRLNDLINIVKARTGKNKVIIITHSMGGLVTRRYAQIFPEKKDIEKAIFITVPNQGIDGNIKNYCSLIGSKIECEDMDKNSILINKLANAPNMSMPVYNIIGVGCKMDSETGDGIVKESSQYLIYANNYYVDGTCDEVNFVFFHETIMFPDEYPEAYELIKGFLKENKK